MSIRNEESLEKVLANNLYQPEEIISNSAIIKKESIFFAYSSRWFIDLDVQEFEKDWEDISHIDIPDDYGGLQHPAKLNVFIMSQAGKPLFFRFGQDSDIIPILGIAYTIYMSMKEDIINNSISNKSISELDKQNETDDQSLYIYGDQQIFTFINKPPLILFSVADYNTKPIDLAHNLESNINNTSNITYEYEYQKISINQQILLLNRVKDFIFSISTESLLLKTYNKYKNFNFNQLLSGSEKILDSWLKQLDINLCINLNCIKYLNILSTYRNTITNVIWNALGSKNVVFAILLYKDYVISLIQQNPYIICPYDMHLLANMINTSSAFKSGEIWTPVCLPNFNSMGFLYAYISFLDPSKRYSLVMLTDQQDAFFDLSEAKNTIMEQLNEQRHIIILNEWLESNKHVYRISDVDMLPAPGRIRVRHFLYIRLPGRFVTAPVFSTLDSDRTTLTPAHRRQIFCAYVSLRHRMLSPSVDDVTSNTERVCGSDEFGRSFLEGLTDDGGDITIPRKTGGGSVRRGAGRLSYIFPVGSHSGFSGGSTTAPILNVSYYRITEPDGIYVGWQKSNYEMYACFDPSTTDEQIQSLHGLILKWITREQKSLFPTFN